MLNTWFFGLLFHREFWGWIRPIVYISPIFQISSISIVLTSFQSISKYKPLLDTNYKNSFYKSEFEKIQAAAFNNANTKSKILLQTPFRPQLNPLNRLPILTKVSHSQIVSCFLKILLNIVKNMIFWLTFSQRVLTLDSANCLHSINCSIWHIDLTNFLKIGWVTI